MTILIQHDFKEFLNLLNSRSVEYLLVGGFAVGFHGYSRPTIDLDIWVGTDPANLTLVGRVVSEFGFGEPDTNLEALQKDRGMLMMGVAPFRLDVLTVIDGVEFPACYANRVIKVYEDLSIDLISLPDLKANKKASGRTKDIDDLEKLD